MMHSKNRTKRKGAMWPLLLACLALMLAGVALAVDTALLWQARQELQVAADASALGAVLDLTEDQLLLRRPGVMSHTLKRAARMAQAISAQHHVLGIPQKLWIEEDDETSDFVAGFHLAHQLGIQPASGDELDSPYINAIEVTARRTRERGTPVGLFFTRLFKLESANVSAHAIATLDRQVVGFRPVGQLTVPLMPIALFTDPSGMDEDSWDAQVEKPLTLGAGGFDEFAYQKASRRWVHASDGGKGDGLPEFLLRLPLGTNLEQANGTLLQIGKVNAFLRQIETGLQIADLDDYQGKFAPGWDGQLLVDELTSATSNTFEQIKMRLLKLHEAGEARIWPLYQRGETGILVQGFVAARIAQVEMTQDYLQVILQPTILTTGSAITEVTAAHNNYVGKIKLVR